MSATPPEANTEYSRGQQGSSGASAPPRKPISVFAGTVSLAVLACGALGATLLVLSEFTHLYSIHIASQHAPVSSVTGGSHNSYAFVPIGVLAALLAVGGARERTRAPLLALVAIGVISLLIALIGDLPDAQAGGLLFRGGHLVIAKASPEAGMYLESLGSIALVLAGGLGLLLGPPPPRPEPRRPRAELSPS
jgi:hypothetical protein